jgi:pSer/pThr/pTyr-binding forkhead associated (FHA) protein/pimeloyl-ACP methyl ester carboxylesterase
MPELQLVIATPFAPVRTLALTKEEIIIGHAASCDLILDEPGVSDLHARLRRDQYGWMIEDLGSAQGTWLGGESTTRARLVIGESVRIATSLLHLQQLDEPVPVNAQLNKVDEFFSGLLLDEPALAERDTTRPRLVIHSPWRTWEFVLPSDATMIGRQGDCQVVLPNANVSRHHARIVREGNDYVLIDLESRNGTWIGGQRTCKHTLHPGDSFRIGDATLVFVPPVTLEDRPVGLPHHHPAPLGARRPVVFVPGYMGSELWLGGERIWPNVKALLANPEVYRWPSAGTIEARQLVSDVIVIPGFIQIDRYQALSDFLCTELGYEAGKDLLEFPWDWRLDPRVAAMQLCDKITAWRDRVKEAELPITIISHSLGCLVARYYVEKLDGYSVVNRMVMLGGTHGGMPKALEAFGAFGKQPLIYGLAEPFQRVIASAPSVYSMLPTYPAVFDSFKNPIDLYHDDRWCPEEYRGHLQNATEFRRELGTKCRVPSICIFGYGIQTATRAILENRNKSGGWDQIRFIQECKGDGTVPEESAMLPGAEIHPVHQNHHALYMDKDVQMRLKLELTR